jgi:hypothetical protein
MLAPSFVSAGAASKSTRTFSDFETVADAMNGICQLYEQRLKQMNPGEHPQLRPTVPMSAAPPPSAYRAPLCALRHLLRRYSRPSGAAACSVLRAACRVLHAAGPQTRGRCGAVLTHVGVWRRRSAEYHLRHHGAVWVHRPGNIFSKVISTVGLSSKQPRALTFEILRM